MRSDVTERPRQQRGLAMLLAAPVVAVALGLCGIEAWRVLHPRSPLFARPFAYSLGDAIAAGDVLQAYRFIRAGQDPNEPIWARHPVLTGRRWTLVSPLLWAVGTRSTQAVQMLLAFGASLDSPENRDAACLAEALGDEDIGRMLRNAGAPPAGAQCPEPRSPDLLLGYSSVSGRAASDSAAGSGPR